MSRFKRLTDAEARTLTRAQLLDRVEAEQKYWARKHAVTPEDRAAEREFGRILFTYLDPGEAMDDLINVIKTGRRSDYWERRPGDAAARMPAMDDNQRAGLTYGLAMLASEREAEQ